MAWRTPLINQIKKHYLQNRNSEVDQDFLAFEESMISNNDLQRILSLLNHRNNSQQEELRKISNPNNSIILYLCNLTDEFDFEKGRSNTIGGSPPDIDIDHDAIDREQAIEWVIDYWGRDQVANIITHGTFKPKSLARSYYRVTEGDTGHLQDLLKKIPPPKYGKEATMKEILEKNPDILEDHRWTGFNNFAGTLEDMVANFGIHAAGLVISDQPIRNIVPTWKNSKADLITQFDMKEVENLGLIKFDFLSIDTLSIIKECSRLIKTTQDLDIKPYDIEDHDPKAYAMLHEGLLTGIFQMETSGMAKKLILKIKPTSIEELSDISALNRPGPLQAGLDDEYIKNKNAGYAPENLPENLAELLKTSYWTLIYQEQVMAICSDIAGFSQKESDDIRRAMGKKDLSVLTEYKKKFLDGCAHTGLLALDYAEDLWEDLLGFADYCLIADTKVMTPNGNKTLIEIINEPNTNILSFDDNSDIVSQNVAQRWSRGLKQVYTYTMEDGTSVTCTPDHKFMVTTGEMLPIQEIYENNYELIKTKSIGDKYGQSHTKKNKKKLCTR